MPIEAESAAARHMLEHPSKRTIQRMPKTAGQIHAEIMQAVREGRFLPGCQLPNERRLAELYGTSRQQIRDALLIMQEAGLVNRRVGSGTYLATDAPQIIEQLDADVDVNAKHDHSFIETIEARMIFEPGVAALAARNISEADLATLKQVLESILAASNWLDYKSRIYHFSRVYYAASGNSFLLRTFDQIIEARQAHKFDGHRETAAVAEIVRRHTYGQLGAIYEAIADRDEAKTEEVTRDYLISIAAATGLS